MKCQVCNSREATVHLTELKGGKKHEMHLCEKCAAEKGLPGKQHFSISDLLAGIASAQQTQKPENTREAQCHACGITLSKFQSSGRFGCPECYTAFRDDILPLIEKIHDASQHTGKVPMRISREVSLQKDIRSLQLDLKKTIKREEYEKAVQIRDQIRILEEQLKGLTQAGAPLAAADAAPPAKRARKSAPKKDPKDKDAE